MSEKELTEIYNNPYKLLGDKQVNKKRGIEETKKLKKNLDAFFPEKFPKGKFGKAFSIMGQREKILKGVK